MLSPKITGSSMDSHKKDTTYTKHTIGHTQYATQNNSCKYIDKNKINAHQRHQSICYLHNKLIHTSSNEIW